MFKTILLAGVSIVVLAAIFDYFYPVKVSDWEPSEGWINKYVKYVMDPKYNPHNT